MPRLINRTVFPLSGRANASASYADPKGVPWDAAVAGQMFQYATAEDKPLVRYTAEISKQQQDTEAEPGEQSLTGWWLRSQESFHKGSGILYQESRISQEASERFRESMGIDVWTPGQVSMLPETVSLQAGAGSSLLAQGVDGSTPVVFQASGSTLYRITDSGSTAVTWGGTGTIRALEVTPTNYYAVGDDGIYRGTIAGGAGTKVWNFTSAPGSVFYRRPFGSGALLLMDNNHYDLSDETGTLPKALPSGNAYIEPNVKWTACVSAKGDIRAAMVTGGATKFWRYGYTGSGWLFNQTAGLPAGETVHSMVNYYNTYLVMGTSRGVRFASYVSQNTGSNGDVDYLYTYGPLVWEVPAGGGDVTGVHVIDRYVYATANNAMPDGTCGLIRINPETDVGQNTYQLAYGQGSGRFAWASDLSSGVSGATGEIADLGGRPVFTVVGSGSFTAHLTNKAPTGYLKTGRIRFRTLEPKLFKYIKVRTDALNGSVAVTAINDADTSSAVITYSVAGTVDHDEASLPQILGPQESMALQFTFARSQTDPTKGPVFRSYQVKAMPAPKRQRMFRLPLACFDNEKLRTGQQEGYTGYGLARLRALESAEEAGDLVLYQDFASGDARLCVIEQIQFQQTSPPGRASGWGGVATVTLRAVD